MKPFLKKRNPVLLRRAVNMVFLKGHSTIIFLESLKECRLVLKELSTNFSVTLSMQFIIHNHYLNLECNKCNKFKKLITFHHYYTESITITRLPEMSFNFVM